MAQLTERVGRSAPDDLIALRARLQSAMEALDTGGTRTIGEGPTRILQFGHTNADTLVVHFHGGGYRQGQPEMSAHYAASLAQAAEVEVWCPAYRLAPEHPFPAALVDATATLSYVASRNPRHLVLSGDSAGGGLAAALVQIYISKGITLTGLILHSPWLDLRIISESHTLNAHSDPFFSKEAATAAAEAYLQGHRAIDPLATPLLADLSAFPPTLVSVGSGEVLLDDAAAFHRNLIAAGVKSALCQIDGMEHVAVTRGFHHIGAQAVFEETTAFLAKVCDNGAHSLLSPPPRDIVRPR